MPIVCINRPNRRKRRLYSEKDAGRIVCRVVSQGGDRAKLVQEIEKCLDLCDKEKIRQKVEQLLQAAIALSILLGGLIGAGGVIAAILLRIPLGYLLLPLLRRLLPDPTKAIQKGIEIEGIAKEIFDILSKPK